MEQVLQHFAPGTIEDVFRNIDAKQEVTDEQREKQRESQTERAAEVICPICSASVKQGRCVRPKATVAVCHSSLYNHSHTV